MSPHPRVSARQAATGTILFMSERIDSVPPRHYPTVMIDCPKKVDNMAKVDMVKLC